jgi:hypothetical protein
MNINVKIPDSNLVENSLMLQHFKSDMLNWELDADDRCWNKH